LEVDLVAGPETFHEVAVRTATTKKHVLAVVEGESVSLNGRCESTKVWSALYERHANTGVGQC
jgi:hypothetical protein